MNSSKKENINKQKSVPLKKQILYTSFLCIAEFIEPFLVYNSAIIENSNILTFVNTLYLDSDVDFILIIPLGNNRENEINIKYAIVYMEVNRNITKTAILKKVLSCQNVNLVEDTGVYNRKLGLSSKEAIKSLVSLTRSNKKSSNAIPKSKFINVLENLHPQLLDNLLTSSSKIVDEIDYLTLPMGLCARGVPRHQGVRLFTTHDLFSFYASLNLLEFYSKDSLRISFNKSLKETHRGSQISFGLFKHNLKNLERPEN